MKIYYNSGTNGSKFGDSYSLKPKFNVVSKEEHRECVMERKEYSYEEKIDDIDMGYWRYILINMNVHDAGKVLDEFPCLELVFSIHP